MQMKLLAFVFAMQCARCYAFAATQLTRTVFSAAADFVLAQPTHAAHFSVVDPLGGAPLAVVMMLLARYTRRDHADTARHSIRHCD